MRWFANTCFLSCLHVFSNFFYFSLTNKSDLRYRTELEEFAETCIHYTFAPGLTEEQLTPAERELISEEYKKSAVRKMTNLQLVEIIMTQPSVIIEKPADKHMVTDKIVMEPLTNLTFCRDQQITTGAGIVMGSMKMVQRVCLSLFFNLILLISFFYSFLLL